MNRLDEIQPGVALEKYVVEGLLGEGGMARVFKVRHQTLGTPHALKVLTSSSPAVHKRLLAEGRSQASLRHPNVVSVTDVLELPLGTALIMEYVDGPDLEDLLQERRLTIPQVRELAEGILSGVAFAHQNGLIHRDLKPANILCQRRNGALVPKVADFGLVKSAGGLSTTRSGVAMGTPRYMAPEQIRDAKNVDHRADVFSLGVILYDLLTRRDCFAPGSDDMFAVFSDIMAGTYIPVSEHRPDAPAAMVNAIDRALSPDREVRVGSVEELAAIFLGQQKNASIWEERAQTPAPAPRSAPSPVPTGAGATVLGFTDSHPTPAPAVAGPPAPPVGTPPSVDPAKLTIPWVPIAIGGVVLMLGTAALVIGLSSGPPQSPPSPTPVPLAVPVPTRPTTTSAETTQPASTSTPDAPTNTPDAPTPSPTRPAPVPAAPVKVPAPSRVEDTPPPKPTVPAPLEPPVATQQPEPEPLTEPTPTEPPPSLTTWSANNPTVRLRNGGTLAAPGTVQPGNYEVVLVQGTRQILVGKTNVKAGDTKHINCSALTKTCTGL